MPIALLLALAIWPFHGANPAPVRHQHVDGWVVRTHLDRFTGHLSCRLYRDRVSFERQAVVFHFPVRLDTFDADYSVDDGKLRGAADDAAELASMGFALQDDDLHNPSGGLVRIPWRRLSRADWVEVEAKPYARSWRFRLAGLADALDAAKDMGCASFGEPER